MPSTDVTEYLAPYARRRVRRPVRLELTRHTFPLEPSPADSWLALAFRAFSRLAGRMEVRDVLIVGTGNGLDALGAVEILEPRSLVVTDLHAESLAVSRRNVLAHLEHGGPPELCFLAGDLLACVPPERRFCLVYENLPNVRASAGMDVELGTVGGRFFADTGLRVPERFEVHQLVLHHECLQQAHGRVRAGGGVLTAIGGRVGLDVAFDLHRSCGYEPELLVFDAKIQTEPNLVLPGYARAERERGVEFRFYAPEAVAVVGEARRAGLDGHALARATEEGLERLALSAGEALARTRRGQAVAHTVFLVFGLRGEALPAGPGGELSPVA